MPGNKLQVSTKPKTTLYELLPGLHSQYGKTKKNVVYSWQDNFRLYTLSQWRWRANRYMNRLFCKCTKNHSITHNSGLDGLAWVPGAPMSSRKSGSICVIGWRNPECGLGAIYKMSSTVILSNMIKLIMKLCIDVRLLWN